MDEKTLVTLEYPKILEKLAGYCAFEASADKARRLHPTIDLDLARLWQAETREAVLLLGKNASLTIGGARDIRAVVDLAIHGGTLTPQDLLDVKYTLISARTLARTFERMSLQYPYLSAIVNQLPPPLRLVDTISRAISDHGDILDSASVKLEIIRRDLRISHDRLLTKLQRMLSDPKHTPYLQEALITQRDGRYVIPLRSEFKGRIRSIVHDQSASGATLFVEPLAVVELNNRYRELLLAERDEERRILSEISAMVADRAFEILTTVDIIAELDFALARGKYAEDLRANEPSLFPITPKKTGHPGTIIRLIEARHPLLDQKTVIPIDVELDENTFAMVITGPNTGGKTVALKTIGLLALMAQSGMHIPAHSSSQISLFENIFSDIGDEQSIEQSLSTFSGHITNIIRILEQANQRSLVILDELGAGTDPTEGAALARAILSYLLERKISTLVTTHHPELKTYAHATPGVVNASVEFNLETLQPTYHLTIGLPGRSNALAIAQRLGLPESIIQAGRAELSPEEIRSEDLLDEIHRQRDLTRKARETADHIRQEVEILRAELLERLERIEEERHEILEQARIQGEKQVAELETEMNEIRQALVRARQPIEALKTIERQVDLLEEKVEAPVQRSAFGEEISRSRSIRLGDKVRLRNLGSQGVVTALSGEEAEVQVGVLRVRTRLHDLELVAAIATNPAIAGKKRNETAQLDALEAGIAKEPGRKAVNANLLPESPGIELDIRGRRADEALEALDRYLDAAAYAGMPYVRIIHGKGTGRLREVVRQALHDSAHVVSFEPGGQKEGGEGVTVVKLAS